MAHDKTPPRNRMILVFTLLTPAVLIGLVPFFHTYFIQMTEGETAERLAAAPPDSRDAIFAAERQKLETGPMPIDRAMQTLGSRGRDASPIVAPTPSDDLSALSGWGPMADDARVAAAQAAHDAAHAPPPPPPVATVDAPAEGAPAPEVAPAP